ncbi:MAG TPA: glutaredoxin domain-containing protein [Polyangiaceae bacterium]|nr:glutaredoxin domain-containing protein [Polyangiaceae bacterium]
MRNVLPEAKIHPAIADKVANYHRDIVDEVQSAAATSDVLVVGMKQNPFPRKACAALKAAGVDFKYLEYGSYLGEWRRRSALKMWTGWPTFPMVFVKGQFVGGCEEIKQLIDKGELKQLLS